MLLLNSSSAGSGGTEMDMGSLSGCKTGNPRDFGEGDVFVHVAIKQSIAMRQGSSERRILKEEGYNSFLAPIGN